MRGPAALLVVLVVASCSKGGGDAPQKTDRGKDAAPARAKVTPAPGYDTGALGALRFDVSGGTPEAQQHFVQGLLALHSFWYEEATAQFMAAIEADASFSMGYWGLAMSKAKLLWGDDDLRGGRAALAQLPMRSGLTPRERSWVEAADALFAEGDVRSSRTRFAAAMKEVNARYPDDESATFLAAALLAATRPGDPDHAAVRQRAADLAAEVFARNPQHPGAAHYLIHALDTPELAHLALPAARAYAKIAPAAFHARHMPAHIFARLGLWKEAIASCQSAWDASVAFSSARGLPATHHDYHSLSWLVEMNFELGLRAAADAAMKTFADSVRAGLDHSLRSAYAGLVTSYMARTGEWKRVDELLAPLDAPATDDAAAPVPSAPIAGGESAGAGSCGDHAPRPPDSPMALLEQRAALSARVRAASSRRQVSQTTRLVAQLEALDARLRPFMSANQPPAALAKLDEQTALGRQTLLARARGDDRALLEAMRKLADRDDAEFSAEGAGSGIVPRELVAETLLRLGRAAEARADYEKVLHLHPGRGSALLGAARAAAKAGDADAARAHYRALAELWAEAQEPLDGLAEARTAAAAATEPAPASTPP